MLLEENRAYLWARDQLKTEISSGSLLKGDASFRQYFRLMIKDKSLILMNSPPEKEPLQPFVHIHKKLKTQGLRVPTIHYIHETEGFVLLEDFGDTLFLDALNKYNASAMYQEAIDQLILLQETPTLDLPLFDENFLIREFSLFTEWFLKRYLQLTLSPAEEKLLNATFHYLKTNLMQQPQVFVHRDYHSRNLMVLPAQPACTGVIDFQDALQGPFTYDLVSLLKDCYIKWPREQILEWVAYFYQHSAFTNNIAYPQFIENFDLAGLQRHLKVLGIFARLYLRDHKSQYLNDLPLTLEYCLEYCAMDSKLASFYEFLIQKVKLP